jgi:membrane-bound lytic murein transglycosylase B
MARSSASMSVSRLCSLLLFLWGAGLAGAVPVRASENDTEFRGFVSALWSDARQRGVTRATFDEALGGVVPDAEVLRLTKRQPEYNSPVGEYLKRRVSQGLLAGGRRQAAKLRETLAAIEAKYGVDPYVVVAIWGLETNYGGFSGGKDVIRSLATLAHARYRDDFFRNELLAALQILQEGHIERPQMKGSWAGAMGQAQFIPSSFLKFAVDFSGDGRRDIWTSVPDVLASIANYLKEHGWQLGVAWGYEVTIPDGFDYRRSRATYREWAALGVRRADGAPFPKEGGAILFFPSGSKGPGFLATSNFEAIRKYNLSDAYTLSVATLADQMRGRKAFVGNWPEVRPLSRERRIWMQKRLAALGYKVNNFVGQIDFDLRDRIREAQARAGLLPDGYATEALLAELAR